MFADTQRLVDFVVRVVHTVQFGCVQHQKVGVLEQVLAQRWPVEVVTTGRLLDDREPQGRLRVAVHFDG